MASIFTKIVLGEIPAYKVAEDENYFAFLDINPLSIGHTLVIPKKEVDYLFDLDDKTYAGLMAFTKKVAASIERVVPCKRLGMVVYGMDVPHAHIHLIPLHGKGNEINFKNPRVDLSANEFNDLADAISNGF